MIVNPGEAAPSFRAIPAVTLRFIWVYRMRKDTHGPVPSANIHCRVIVATVLTKNYKCPITPSCGVEEVVAQDRLTYATAWKLRALSG